MKIYFLLDPESRTDLNEILGKNFLVRDRLVKPICKFVILVTETSSKVQKSRTYDETINDLIYNNRY